MHAATERPINGQTRLKAPDQRYVQFIGDGELHASSGETQVAVSFGFSSRFPLYPNYNRHPGRRKEKVGRAEGQTRQLAWREQVRVDIMDKSVHWSWNSEGSRRWPLFLAWMN